MHSSVLPMAGQIPVILLLHPKSFATFTKMDVFGQNINNYGILKSNYS